jgi:hypothetical protein
LKYTEIRKRWRMKGEMSVEEEAKFIDQEKEGTNES